MSPAALFVAGLLVAAVIAFAARATGALDRGGAVAATLAGAIATSAGLEWAILLIAYFLSSAALSRFRSREKSRRTGAIVEKGGSRDWVQVAANGGVFLLIASASHIWSFGWLETAAAGALAASAADTWATEVGVLSSAGPRSITTFRPVPPGTSGGVTIAGFAGASTAALLLAALAGALFADRTIFVPVVAGGVLACVVDSVVGAIWQSRRICSECGTLTERQVHDCGRPTTHHSGMRWLDNDAVNFVATAAGALVAVTLRLAL